MTPRTIWLFRDLRPEQCVLACTAINYCVFMGKECGTAHSSRGFARGLHRDGVQSVRVNF